MSLEAGGGGAAGGGDASAANQTTGNASLSSIDGKTPALVSGRQPVDGSGVTQPVSAAALPLPAGASTEATLSTLNGKVTAVNTGAVTVASSALPAGAATAAKQDDSIAQETAIYATLATGITVFTHSSVIDVTLSTDTAAHASGDVIADTQVVTNAMRANDTLGVLQSVTVICQADQKAAIDIYILSANVSMGTENAAPSISDANALEILGPPISIAISDYKDLGNVSTAGKDAIGKVVKPATGTRNLYVAVVNGTGTPTYANGNDLKLRLAFLTD